MKLSLDQARERVAATLQRAGASAEMAAHTARALVLAEAQGQGGHGLSRVAQYTTHLKNGRAVGTAVPAVLRRKGASCIVDAHEGLAFPACALAIAEAIATAREHGIALAGVVRSHHGGVLVDHLRPVAEAGMVGLAFTNSPSAMPAAGGKHPVFGTNPIAAAFPRKPGADPLLIDLSLSEAARGKVMVAAKAGQPIPLGWALDEHGQPTTDAAAALKGSMLPIGAATSSKGAMLALVVELLATALIGANYGFEASSFFVDEGNRPGLGQTFFVIDPRALAGQGYFERVEVLVAEMLKDEGLRLPGARREALRRKAELEGIEVPDTLLAQWEKIG
jgi:(2R)-3-sulfolactate dehydrogenase (NADP+)